MAEPIVRAERLHKFFRRGSEQIDVLNDLSLEVPEGEVRVLTALDLVGLSDRLSHRPGQLSGGQQQRVGIARAVVTDPTLIVADEPTGDLDAKSAEEILNLMAELKKALNKTILMVTHDPRAAQRALRVLHLDKGQLVEAAGHLR